MLWGLGLFFLCSFLELEMGSFRELSYFLEVLKVVKVEFLEDKGGVIVIVKKVYVVFIVCI